VVESLPADLKVAIAPESQARELAKAVLADRAGVVQSMVDSGTRSAGVVKCPPQETATMVATVRALWECPFSGRAAGRTQVRGKCHPWVTPERAVRSLGRIDPSQRNGVKAVRDRVFTIVNT
jgi:hypothetical protein